MCWPKIKSCDFGLDLPIDASYLIERLVFFLGDRRQDGRRVGGAAGPEGCLVRAGQDLGADLRDEGLALALGAAEETPPADRRTHRPAQRPSC